MELNIKKVLMRRDGLSEYEAQERVELAREELQQILEEEGPYSERAYHICQDHFGLEPDYLMDLIPPYPY